MFRLLRVLYLETYKDSIEAQRNFYPDYLKTQVTRNSSEQLITSSHPTSLTTYSW